MSKAVLISIRPKWVEKIASGEKTIEVRKTRPNLPTPFKAYIYCSQGNDARRLRGSWGKVIGEFTCDRIVPITYDGGRLWCPTNAAFSPATCLSQAEIIAYIGDKGRCYGWHISDLRIYDAPKCLFEFWAERLCRRDPSVFGCGECCDCDKRPPQSWCYVLEDYHA
jgi:predicted transcriptional regulator